MSPPQALQLEQFVRRVSVEARTCMLEQNVGRQKHVADGLNNAFQPEYVPFVVTTGIKLNIYAWKTEPLTYRPQSRNISDSFNRGHP